MTEKTQDITLRGKLHWAHLFKPDPKYGKYSLDLLLDEENLKVAREQSLRVKHKSDYENLYPGYSGHYIKADRAAVSKKGDPIDPPDVYNSKVQPIKAEIGIGHGTDATVKSMIKTQDITRKEMSPAEAMSKYDGYGLYLKAVMIRNLIPYEVGESKDFVEEEGSFVAPPDSKQAAFDFKEGDDLPFDPE